MKISIPARQRAKKSQVPAPVDLQAGQKCIFTPAYGPLIVISSMSVPPTS